MTVPEGTTRAWGARATISVTVHIPFMAEDKVKAAVEARLVAATKAATRALTRGPHMHGSYATKPDASVGVTELHWMTTGIATTGKGTPT